MNQTSAETRIIALEAQLRIDSQPKKGDVKLEGETPKTNVGENQSESCSNFPGKGWQFQESQLTLMAFERKKVDMISVKDAVSCTSVQAEQ